LCAEIIRICGVFIFVEFGIEVVNIPCVFSFIITGSVIIAGVLLGFIETEFQNTRCFLIELQIYLKSERKESLFKQKEKNKNNAERSKF